jgi:hypothetical protein
MKWTPKVGDPVTLYWNGAEVYEGEIASLEGQGRVLVRVDNEDGKTGSMYHAHRRQCRFRKVERPSAPKKREARRIWIYESCFAEVLKLSDFDCLTENPQVFTRRTDAIGSSGKEPMAEFREVLPGEVTISREELAKAWDSFCYPTQDKSSDSFAFKNFAKYLGLEVPK